LCFYYRQAGIFASERPVISVLDRIEPLEPTWAHAMRGGSIPADALPPYLRALREQPYFTAAVLFGRHIAT
jgi:hypothetical protein